MIACATPRHVFVDLGVNWCNTIRLFEDVEVNKSAVSAYHVYGFEASPLIQPFAEEYFAWLNDERVDEPETCLPRSGSTSHLLQFAPVYGWTLTRCVRACGRGWHASWPLCARVRVSTILA